MSHESTPLGLLPVVSAALVAGGCLSSHSGANRSNDVREVGSVHVAVLSVAPWSRYVEKLQPRFELSEELALQEVVRDSRIGRTDEINAIGLTGERVSRSEEADGEVPERSLSVGRDGIPPWLDNLEQTPAQKPDPFLEYTAAAALYQEVQLLNSAVRDAAIPDGHVGYVVRLQITLLPRRRHAPYDAYTTIGFFLPDDLATDGSPSGGGGAAPATPMRGDGDLVARNDVVRGPRVLPLLVTDALEATLRERGSEEAFALSLSLASFKPELSQLIGFDQIQQASQDFLRGRDLNATMTVGRLAENALQVRLGAMQEVTAKYAMVPRTYNITALVTVPAGRTEELELVARTRIVDAETGEELPGTSPAELERLVGGVMTDYGLGAERALGEALLGRARANDDAGFDAALAAAVDRSSDAWRQRTSLWIDLVGLVAGSQYASDRIDLPDPAAAGTTSDFFYEQTPLLTDDGVVSVVRVVGLQLDEGTTAEALLEVEGATTARIPAEAVNRSSDRSFVQLTFPSLRSAGLLVGESSPRIALRLRWGDQEMIFDVVTAR